MRHNVGVAGLFNHMQIFPACPSGICNTPALRTTSYGNMASPVGVESEDDVIGEWTTQSTGNGGGNRPYVDHPTCPRKPVLTIRRVHASQC